MDVRCVLGAAAVLAVLACGCTPADEPVVTVTPGPAASTSATPSPAPAPASDPAQPADDDPGTVTALLTDVRSARQEGFDRVTFEFTGALPRYDVRYVERPILSSGSGEEVAVEGAGVLRIRLEPASGYDLDASARTYQGPPRVVSDTENVVETVSVGDFEAVLEWAVGVRSPTAYEVETLEDPPRVVIDVSLPAP